MIKPSKATMFLIVFATELLKLVGHDAEEGEPVRLTVEATKAMEGKTWFVKDDRLIVKDNA
jgi:hypothetical protein